MSPVLIDVLMFLIRTILITLVLLTIYYSLRRHAERYIRHEVGRQLYQRAKEYERGEW